MTISTVIIFFVILFVLVLVHEAGHFFAAKLSKMRVDEFAFGFPPKLFSVKKGETVYSFNALPLGGYVKIHGENGSDEEIEDKHRSFGARPWYQQIFVLCAGVLMNIILAWILLSATFALGTPFAKGSSLVDDKYISGNQTLISSVAPSSPAAKSGLVQGDAVVRIESVGESIDNPTSDAIPTFVQSHADKTITITAKKQSGESAVYNIQPELNAELGKKIIGITTGEIGTYKAPLHVAFFTGAIATYEFTKLTFIGFADLIASLFNGHAKEAGEALTGPVGIVSLVGDAQKDGIVAILSFAALISINLAVLNILPLPALDGGRVVFVLIETIRGRKLSINFQTMVNGISFLLLIALMIYVTVKDVVKLF